MLDDAAEQLVEAAVDPVGVEALAELARDLEQERCRLGLPLELALAHPLTVAEFPDFVVSAG